jgi:catechol 2,3-dioxygenase-like lactoylglutathione lyase family enzyme
MKAITVPILPSADLDDSIAFYEALGFERTYRQKRPNPSAVVELGEIGIHLFELEGFDPASSYGSVIIAVSDPDDLYARFAEGLRARFGKLPSSGIPRILRPRKRHGTVRGFSVVDPGGNWLRVSRLGDREDTQEATTGLARVIENAARIGDAKGDDIEAARLLRNGLERFSEGPPIERARALLYLAELYIRLGDSPAAHESLAEASSIEMSDEDRESIMAEFAHTREVVGQEGSVTDRP